MKLVLRSDVIGRGAIKTYFMDILENRYFHKTSESDMYYVNRT